MKESCVGNVVACELPETSGFSLPDGRFTATSAYRRPPLCARLLTITSRSSAESSPIAQSTGVASRRGRGVGNVGARSRAWPGVSMAYRPVSTKVRLIGHFRPDSGRCRLTVPRDGFLGHSRVLQKTCLELLWAGSVANFQGVPNGSFLGASHAPRVSGTIAARIAK